MLVVIMAKHIWLSLGYRWGKGNHDNADKGIDVSGVSPYLDRHWNLGVLHFIDTDCECMNSV